MKGIAQWKYVGWKSFLGRSVCFTFLFYVDARCHHLYTVTLSHWRLTCGDRFILRNCLNFYHWSFYSDCQWRALSEPQRRQGQDIRHLWSCNETHGTLEFSSHTGTCSQVTPILYKCLMNIDAWYIWSSMTLCHFSLSNEHLEYTWRNAWNLHWRGFMVDNGILSNNMNFPSHECSIAFCSLAI